MRLSQAAYEVNYRRSIAGEGSTQHRMSPQAQAFFQNATIPEAQVVGKAPPASAPPKYV